MIFILLSSFAYSKFSVPFLNNKTFENLVERRSRADVWVVFFQGISQSLKRDKGDKAAEEMLAIVSNGFTNASKISMGLKFAIVDVSRYPQIPEKFNIKRIPSIHIFYDGGDHEYVGNYRPKNILKSGIAHQANFVKNISESWKTEFIAQPSVMMFSDKEKIPTVWRSLAIYYYGKSIRIGFTNNEDLFFPFEIKKTPTILFSNGTHQITYKGKVSFNKLTDAIDRFFARNLNSDTFSNANTDENATEKANKTDFEPAKKFRDLCIGAKSHCVLIKIDKATPKIEEIRKSYSRMKFTWLVGNTGLPYDFMKKKEGSWSWIYNPRRDAFIDSDVDGLGNALESIVNGNAKWVKRDAMINNEL